MRRTDPEFELMVVESKIRDFEIMLEALKGKRKRLKTLIARRPRYDPIRR